MRHGSFAVALLLLVLILPNSAFSYQFEATASYAEGDGDVTDTESTSVEARWFLRSVPMTDAPLAEAGYLSQTSSIRYGFRRDESELDFLLPMLITPPPIIGPALPPPGLTARPVISGGIGALMSPFSTSTEIDRHSLHYAHIHKDSGWFGEISGSTVDGETESFIDNDIDGHGVFGAFGRYLTDALTVKVYVAQEDQESGSVSSNGCPGLLFCLPFALHSSLETETFSVGISSKYVGQLGAHYYAVSGFLQHDEVDAEFTTRFTSPGLPPFGMPIQSSMTVDNDIGDIWKVGASATWYFSRHLGLGAEYRLTDTRADQDQSYALSGRWFVTENIELRLQFRRTHLEGARDDLDQIGLTIGGRI